jgi:predicted transcriptional regulator
MELPQEIMLWYVVPAIRKALVLELKKKGLKQKDIAVLMGISEPAISQYVTDKRATICAGCFNKAFEQEVSKAAERIFHEKKESTTMQEVNRLCTFVKDNKILCEVHKTKDSKFKGCEICYS